MAHSQNLKDMFLETYRTCAEELGNTNALTVQLKSLMLRHLKMNVEISDVAKGGNGFSAKSVSTAPTVGLSRKREIFPKSTKSFLESQSLAAGAKEPTKAEIIADKPTDQPVMFDPEDLTAIAEMTPEQLLEKLPISSIRNLSVELGFGINKNKSDQNFIKDFLDHVKGAVKAQTAQGATVHAEVVTEVTAEEAVVEVPETISAE